MGGIVKERFTFEEIKEFKRGDLFWTKDSVFEVNSEPTYITESNFYGDFSEKIEWTAISHNTRRQSNFQVSNVRGKGNASNPIIYKVDNTQGDTNE
jgi:hypothetical protein